VGILLSGMNKHSYNTELYIKTSKVRSMKRAGKCVLFEDYWPLDNSH